MKSRGREGFTLVELLAAVGIGAGTAVALAGLSWGVVRLAEGQSARGRTWRAEAVLHRMAQDFSCAYAPPTREGDEPVFLAERSTEAGEAEGRLVLWRPEERAAWSETYGVRRVAYEWRKSGKRGGRVLTREERPSSGPGTNFPVKEVLLEGDFSMEAWVREAPGRPEGEGGRPAAAPKAGEWLEGTWPLGEEGSEGEGKKRNPLPGWVRVAWEGGGERRVVESVVQAAHFVPSMRGGVVAREEGNVGEGMEAMKGKEGMEGSVEEGGQDD